MFTNNFKLKATGEGDRYRLSISLTDRPSEMAKAFFNWNGMVD
jgi:hypothetical protein